MIIQVTWDFDLPYDEDDDQFMKAHIKRAQELGVPCVINLFEFEECKEMDREEIGEWLSCMWGFCFLNWKILE